MFNRRKEGGKIRLSKIESTLIDKIHKYFNSIDDWSDIQSKDIVTLSSINHMIDMFFNEEFKKQEEYILSFNTLHEGKHKRVFDK